MNDNVTRARELINVVQYRKVKVTVTKGVDAGLSLEMTGSVVRIGTSPENDLVLTDDTVSRRHCELESGERGVRITDPGSTNGILLNNVKIKDATVTALTSLQL